MKSRLLTLLIPALFIFTNSNGQYKDLEGVFFGKVVALGVGASFQSYQEKQIGSQTSITPLTYSVMFSNKAITSFRVAIHNRYEVKYDGNDGFDDYTQTAKFKFWEYEVAIRGALTSEGIEKPTSVFFMVQGGFLGGKVKTEDTRYGLLQEESEVEMFAGGGLTLYQRLGSRAVLFAEPAYRFNIKPGPFKLYIGDNSEKRIKLSHANVHIGVMFLIGKKE